MLCITALLSHKTGHGGGIVDHIHDNVADMYLGDPVKHRHITVCGKHGMNRMVQTALRLEALGNPTRLGVYHLLVRAGSAGLPVGKVQKTLGIPASTLSHHLKHLESVNLVQRKKQGVTHYCIANYETMDTILSFLTEECCADAEMASAHEHHIYTNTNV